MFFDGDRYQFLLKNWPPLFSQEENKSFADFPRSFSRAAVQTNTQIRPRRGGRNCRAAVSLLFRVNDAGSCGGLLNGKNGVSCPSKASGPVFFVPEKGQTNGPGSIDEGNHPRGMTKSNSRWE